MGKEVDHTSNRIRLWALHSRGSSVRACLLIGAIFLLLSVSTTAGKVTADGSSAVVLVRAGVRYFKSIEGMHSQLHAQVRYFIRHIAVACPRVLARNQNGSEKTAEQTLREVAVAELILTGEAPLRKVSIAFANTIRNLNWTHRSIAQALSTFAQGVHAIFRVTRPGYCTIANKTASEGFRTPVSAVRFLDEFRAAVDGGRIKTLAVIANMTRTFLPHADLRMLGLLHKLENRVDRERMVTRAMFKKLQQVI